MSDAVPVTIFPAPHRWSLKGVRRDASWAQILRTAQKPELWPGEASIAESADRLPGILAGRIRDDARVMAPGGKTDKTETEERIEDVGALLVEYVDEPLVDERHLQRWWKDHRFVAWTSPWHMRPFGDRPPGPRWIVLVPFARPVSLDRARMAARWVRHPHRSAGHVHPNTDDLARVVPLPAVVPGGYAWTSGEGHPLDIDALEAQMEQWDDEDRLEQASHATRGTTLPEAIHVFRDRLAEPGRRALLPWPGACTTLPEDGPELHLDVPDLSALGRLAGSLWPGRLAVLAGASGAGRTALALQLAEAAAREGHPVLYASAGLTADELVARLIVLRSANGGDLVPASHAAILQGSGDPGELARAAEHLVQALPHLYLWTPTTPERTDEVLRTRALGVAQASGGRPPLVIVDPVEGFEDGKALSAAYRELSAACRDLVRPGSLAPDWPGAAVLAVVGAPASAPDLATATTLRTAAEDDVGRARLRESLALEVGGLGTDAGLLLAVARDNSGPDGIADAVVVVCKNRHGHTGVVPLRFHGAAGLFSATGVGAP